MNPGGFNGLPNIKMEDGVMGSMGLKVRTLNIFKFSSDETLWQHGEDTPELTVEKTDDDFDTEHWIFATDLMGSISVRIWSLLVPGPNDITPSVAHSSTSGHQVNPIYQLNPSPYSQNYPEYLH